MNCLPIRLLLAAGLLLSHTSVLTGLDLSEPDIFRQKGWSSQGTVQLLSKKGAVSGSVYKKTFLSHDVAWELSAITLESGSSFWVGQQAQHYVLSNGNIIGLNWTMGTTLRYSDLNVAVDSKTSFETRLNVIEKAYVENPKNLIKLRTFKNVFGPFSSTLAWEFESVSFGGDNLVLHFKNADGIATLELDTNLGYVRSAMDGKEIDPATVKVMPITTLAEVISKAEAQAKNGEDRTFHNEQKTQTTVVKSDATFRSIASATDTSSPFYPQMSQEKEAHFSKSAQTLTPWILGGCVLVISWGIFWGIWHQRKAASGK